jgi:hypothetical protein
MSTEGKVLVKRRQVAANLERGEYYRNLADKNQSEDNNNRVDRAITYFQAEKCLGFLFPGISFGLIVFFIETHGVPLSEKSRNLVFPLLFF